MPESTKIGVDGEVSAFSVVAAIHQAGEGPLVTFRGGDTRDVYVTFPKGDLEALGWPDTVTVTVEPGNALEVATEAVVQSLEVSEEPQG